MKQNKLKHLKFKKIQLKNETKQIETFRIQKKFN